MTTSALIDVQRPEGQAALAALPPETRELTLRSPLCPAPDLLAALPALPALARLSLELGGLDDPDEDDPSLDLEPLAALPALRALRVDGPVLRDLHALPPTLTALELSPALRSLRSLAGIARAPLERLSAPLRAGLELRPIAALPLRELRLVAGGRVLPFEPAQLSGLGGLERLTLVRAGIPELGELAALPELAELVLDECDIGLLAALPNGPLRRLALIDCVKTDRGAFDLSGLAGRPIEDLTVSGEVTDLQPLAELPALRRLTLRGRAPELGPLGALTGLRQLDLRGSPMLLRDRVLVDREALTQLEVALPGCEVLAGPLDGAPQEPRRGS